MHVIVVGCGRVGAGLASALDEEGHFVAVIDKDRNAFRRLPERFTGRAVLGYGYDRDHLEQAGIKDADAVAAVTSGDNSNILTARIARETYEVGHVVAKIKDPGRAEIYQRLGIPTVAPTTWATHQVMRRLFRDDTAVDWTDTSGELTIVERDLPDAWAGRKLAELDDGDRVRLIAVSRAGTARLAGPALVGQEGDVLHVAVRGDARTDLDAAFEVGPENR